MVINILSSDGVLLSKCCSFCRNRCVKHTFEGEFDRFCGDRLNENEKMRIINELQVRFLAIAKRKWIDQFGNPNSKQDDEEKSPSKNIMFVFIPSLPSESFSRSHTSH